jgi:hypothetical protein
VFYDEKEVTTFDLDKEKNIWRMFYGKPVIPEENPSVYNQLCGPFNIKQIQVPDLPCSADTQRVLTNFNRGLVLEMTSDGDIWATRKCLTKVI